MSGLFSTYFLQTFQFKSKYGKERLHMTCIYEYFLEFIKATLYVDAGDKALSACSMLPQN